MGALCLKYITYRESKGGVSPNHLNCIRAAVRIARVTCEHTPVAAFGPLALQEVRDAMLRVRFGKSDQKRWTRSVINRRVRHVVRMFRGGVSKELVPLHLPAALACVEPLRMGTNATKGKPRRKGQAPTQRSTARKVRDQFTTDSYNRAITRACEKAGVPAWTTHQLRHTASTAARKAFGAEAALLLLGDRSTRMIDVYAEKDQEKAIQVVAKIG